MINLLRNCSGINPEVFVEKCRGRTFDCRPPIVGGGFSSPQETGFIPSSFFFLVPIKSAPTAAASQPRSASRPQTWPAGARAGVVGRRSARRRRVERLGRRAPTRPIPCYPASPWPRTILFCGARAVVSFGRGRRASDGGRPPFPGSNQSSQAACSKGGASPCDRHGRLTPTIRARAQPSGCKRYGVNPTHDHRSCGHEMGEHAGGRTPALPPSILAAALPPAGATSSTGLPASNSPAGAPLSLNAA